MSSFESEHMYILEKEEVGVVFARCFRHTKNPDFLVGIRNSEDNQYIETIYIGTDKKHADELYSSLVFERKKNS